MTVKRGAAWLLTLCAALFVAGCAGRWTESQTFVMNTVLQQTVEAGQNVCDENAQIARDLEQLLSRTIEESEISLIRNSDGPVHVSEDTIAVVSAGLEAWTETGGAFDPSLGAFRDAWGFGTDNPHVPSQQMLENLLQEAGTQSIVVSGDTIDGGGANIDLGGAAKGYALDAMRTSMESQGVENALVSFGGAVLALGERPNGGAWRIGIRDPFSDDASSYIGTMEVSGECIETSGVSEQSFVEDGVRYHHILDPDTGMPVQNTLVAVTVAGESGMMTDILSTALFVMGLEDGLAYAEENSIQAMFITEDKEIVTTTGFRYEIRDLDPAYRIV